MRAGLCSLLLALVAVGCSADVLLSVGGLEGFEWHCHGHNSENPRYSSRVRLPDRKGVGQIFETGWRHKSVDYLLLGLGLSIKG